MAVELRLDPTSAGHPALLLRPWQANDIHQLISIFRDPVLRPPTGPPLTASEAGSQWLAIQSDRWRTGELLSFAVLQEERIVGNVAVARDKVPGDYAEVGYWTAAEARGQGVAPRAVEALTRWAFDTLSGVTRCVLLHRIDNIASCRVAQKAGYVYRRTLPARPPHPLGEHQHVRLSRSL